MKPCPCVLANVLRSLSRSSAGCPALCLPIRSGASSGTKMRERAQASQGRSFDVRAFHQVELEDGMLPFAALEAKLDRWLQPSGGAH